jgi:spore germination cell wall hydrolase CwlJ-like protein
MELPLAKTFGLFRLLSRNDRIMRVGFGGALLYALTIALISPVVSSAATAPVYAIEGKPVLLRLASLRPTLANLEAPGSKPLPMTVVRDEVVNRPAYQAYLAEKNCLATAIYFEARGETAKGQKAVAEVVLARTRVPGRPKTICGVVYEGSKRRTGCQFSFTCDGSLTRRPSRAGWARALTNAGLALSGGIEPLVGMSTGGKVNAVAGGATFYHADYVSPGWATRMVKVAEIGTHIFYRPQRGRHL